MARTGYELTVEIVRDLLTPTVDVDGVGDGVNHVKEIFPHIEIIDNKRTVPIGTPAGDFIVTNKLSRPRIDAHLAIVVTNRLLVFENKQGEIDEGFLAREDPAIMYGIALGYSKLDNQQMPYMVVDQERSQDYIDKVVQHEFGHVFGVKRSGEYYDGESHCTNEQCLLQANRSESPDYCEECSGQFEENGYYFHGREVLGIKTPHHERNPQL